MQKYLYTKGINMSCKFCEGLFDEEYKYSILKNLDNSSTDQFGFNRMCQYA